MKALDQQAIVSKLGKVAVFYGGTSAERDVSLESGQAVINALTRTGVDVVPVLVDKNTLREFDPGCCDRVFIALHGRGGEDGSLQGYLELIGLPYTGSNVLASSLAMDKIKTKQVWLACGLPTPDSEVLTAQNLSDVYRQLGPTICVKPVHEGSSIGVQKVTSEHALENAFQSACEYDQQVMAEKWVEGAEFTVGVLGGEALPVIGLKTQNVFYDYEAKYQSDDTQYHLPSGLSAEQEAEMQSLALRAFEAVGCEGWGRVDVMQDADGRNWLLEVNTVPGMTSHSLVPMAADHAGCSFDDLVLRILAQTSA